ncbi:MAG: error-prone DNA polymerase, partial [Pseudomonadota bacterium]
MPDITPLPSRQKSTPPGPQPASKTPYAELCVTTNFTFLRGASHPDELVYQAAALGYQAIGITDWNSLAGIVRAHSAAKEVGLKLCVGTRLVTRTGHSCLAFPVDRTAYGRLTRLLTKGNRRAEKGTCDLETDDILVHGAGMIFILLPPADLASDFSNFSTRLADAFPDTVYCGIRRLYHAHDHKHLAEALAFADRHGLPPVATNDVLYHHAERRPLQDTLSCIREKVTIDRAGDLIEANAERHLKSPEEMARLFTLTPEALTNSIKIARKLTFSLDELAYDYPTEVIGGAANPQEALVALTWEGASERYPQGMPQTVRKAIDYELSLIDSLDYATYFLTVYDLVRFARSRDILCQGRGSAANSVVCFCLGITSVDPTRVDLLFERFISAERREPPDIDVDFEHERREEVIQYIYEKYGRHRAGIAATVITYRSKSAIREVGKVLGLSEDITGRLAGAIWGWSTAGIDAEQIVELGLDPSDERLALCADLSRELIGFPRHLSQHTGGFVITESPLVELVPIHNAAMDDRTVVEWDKDDLDALGMLKVDVLALGMLSCIARGFDLLAVHYKATYDLATVPAEDPAVYDMLCKADSIGVFQVESRAQMTMLPRLKPRNFYDLVIEVAIVRPGPIQGDMVHPYLRRRDGLETVSYPSKALEDVLGKTLGVPLFQEQAMRIAIVAAGFTPEQADKLRRAMATFRKVGIIHQFGLQLVEGMVANGYDKSFAERCFKQIEGFGEYGFPESHAASFALLVYISAWMKWHYPDVFLCAILNSQPMGFYAPAQLVRDAREHGVTVLPVDINRSVWDNTLEPLEPGAHASKGEDGSEDGGKGEGAARYKGDPAHGPRGNRCAVRLGFRQIKGFSEGLAEMLIAARPVAGYDSLWQVVANARLGTPAMTKLAEADCFGSLGLTRRDALWAVKGAGDPPLPLFADRPPTDGEADIRLPAMPLGEEVVHDYASLRLSLKSHPLQLLRQRFAERGLVAAEALETAPTNKPLWFAGLVLVRQRPGSAS